MSRYEPMPAKRVGDADSSGQKFLSGRGKMTMDRTGPNQDRRGKGLASAVLSALLALPIVLGLGFAPAWAAAVTTVTTTATYDDYGNPLQITATTTGGGQTFTTTTTNTYTNDTTNWYLGRLTRAEVTNTLPDLSSATRVSDFAYDPVTGLLVQETIEPGTALALTTDYTHDVYGNRLSATVSGSDIISRTTSTAFSADGRFATSATNALGHSETRAFDARTGAAISLTGPNNLTTTWDYDGFGRKTREVRADGTETAWSFDLCVSQCPTGAIYLVKQRQIITATGFDYAALSIVYFDKLNRGFRKESEGFDGTAVYADTQFNALGQVTQTSRPYFAGTPAQDIQWTLASYDAIGRASTTTVPDGGVSTITYNGLTTTTANALGQSAVEVKNIIGQVVTASDNLGASNTYFYDPYGNLVETTDDAGTQAFMDYDIRGRKTDMDDPDMGVWSYTYNTLGELVSQTDAKFQTVTLAYDKLGRMLSRVEAEGTTSWTYDTAATGIGKIHQVTAPGGYLATSAYDSLGRPVSTSETIGGEVFTASVTFDAAGRVETQTYPSGFAVERNYSLTGFLEDVRDTVSATVYWEANDVSAEGQVLDETLGNGLVTTRAFDPETGLLDTIQTWNGLTALQDDGFVFDKLGSLTRRIDAIQGRQEDFTYDGINRLTGNTLIDAGTLAVLNTTTYAFDSVGNITSKSDAGSYAYTGAGPHAVSGVTGGPAGTLAYAYDANGNMTSGAGRTLTWSSYNKPVYIDGGAVLTFTYGPDRARIIQTATTGTSVKTTKYVGKLYEKRVTGASPAELVHYIRAAGTVAIYTKIDDSNPATNKTRYLHRDHLGSIVSITDEAGVVTEQLSFDPYGQRRATDWQAALFPPTSIETTRGFTGQEQLDGVGLIHMNGRVYDPLLGRFLSADPFVQFPKSTQGLNRYTYVNNSPLSFTDPSGFFLGGFFKAIGNAIKGVVKAVKTVVSKALSNPYVRIGVALVAAYFTAGAASALIAQNAFNAVLATGTFSSVGAAMGAAGAAATAAAASVSTAVIAGAAAGFVGGFIASGGDLKAAGIGALTGGAGGFVGASSAFGSFGRVVARGVVGGASSSLRGGKFATGFIASAGSAALNNWRTTDWSKWRLKASKAVLTDQIRNAPTDWIQVAGKTLVEGGLGGAVSTLQGRSFGSGALTYAASGFANEVYNAYVPVPPRILGPGGPGVQKEDRVAYVIGQNNFGPFQGGSKGGAITEGGWISRLIDSAVPGADSISLIHDGWTNLGKGSICESDYCVSTMIPAAAASYGALFRQSRDTPFLQQ